MRIVVLLFILMISGFVRIQAQSEDAWQPVIDVIEASELRDVVVGVGTENGIAFVHVKGAGGDLAPFITLPIASSSKWLTAATIMRLVEEGVMSLEDHPQAYLEWWTDDPADPRSQITLAQLLSFTSGFEGEPICIQRGSADPETCAQFIYANHFRYPPGTSFYYSSTHMHIAGLMAVQATGEGFNALFRRLIAEPVGMSANAQFDRPSLENPFLAGGARTSAYDYSLFLEALLRGDILAQSRAVMFQDWTAPPIEIVSAPVPVWHYALGAWRECWDASATWVAACDDRMLISSGGGLGWFPWIDLDNGYYGLIARRGTPFSGAVGPSIALAYALRPHIEAALATNR